MEKLLIGLGVLFFFSFLFLPDAREQSDFYQFLMSLFLWFPIAGIIYLFFYLGLNLLGYAGVLRLTYWLIMMFLAFMIFVLFVVPVIGQFMPR